MAAGDAYIKLPASVADTAHMDLTAGSSADMGKNAFYRRHAAVNRHHWDIGIDGLLQGRGHSIHFVRADDNALHALGDRCFDVSGLLG